MGNSKLVKDWLKDTPYNLIFIKKKKKNPILQSPKMYCKLKHHSLGWNSYKDRESWNHDLEVIGGDDSRSEFIHPLITQMKSTSIYPFS